MAEEQPSDSFADDIISEVRYEAALPGKKNFLAWHQPRKQFVRAFQWRDQIASMLDDHGSEGVLRYLGLPGTDLLDIRYFHRTVCNPRKLRLRFLGFNTAAQPTSADQTDLNISLDEVRRMDGVEPTSDVVGDDFVRVANEKSIAWKKAKEFGPFDVVNLDLCDGFGAGPPDSLGESQYDAMTKIMALQARTKMPWLLLLTTRVGSNHVHDEVLTRLLATFLSNLTVCAAFRDLSTAELEIADEESMHAAATDPAGMIPVFLAALCKWLAGLAMGQLPPTTIEVKSVIGYRVAGGADIEDLYSVALRFTPSFEAVPDASGLAKEAPTGRDECATSVQILKRVCKRVDADRVLGDDAALTARLIGESADLLALARYDADAYRQWAGEL